MGGGRTCCKDNKVALGFAENWTKLMRWPMASSMLPVKERVQAPEHIHMFRHNRPT